MRPVSGTLVVPALGRNQKPATDRPVSSRSPFVRHSGPATRTAAAELGAQLKRFAFVGALSTLTHLGLLAVLVHQAVPTQVANLIALLIATVVNTAANRRWTLGSQAPAPLAATTCRVSLSSQLPGRHPPRPSGACRSLSRGPPQKCLRVS